MGENMQVNPPVVGRGERERERKKTTSVKVVAIVFVVALLRLLTIFSCRILYLFF